MSRLAPRRSGASCVAPVSLNREREAQSEMIGLFDVYSRAKRGSTRDLNNY